jgi:SLOG cluster3 family
MGGLILSGAIFLSAGVPDPKRGPEFAKTADTVAITAAVGSLLYVTLGRRLLVWGGHPAITPMILVIADTMGIDYGSWVTLYQSNFFRDEFPEDNLRFKNVVYTEAIGGDRDASLQHMRQRMFNDHAFDAAVFIGGMKGIFDEFDLFRTLQPKSRAIPVISTGGAARELSRKLPSVTADLTNDLDYVALFHRHLDVSVKEQRYDRREKQPPDITSRMWRNGDDADKSGPFTG